MKGKTPASRPTSPGSRPLPACPARARFAPPTCQLMDRTKCAGGGGVAGCTTGRNRCTSWNRPSPPPLSSVLGRSIRPERTEPPAPPRPEAGARHSYVLPHREGAGASWTGPPRPPRGGPAPFAAAPPPCEVIKAARSERRVQWPPPRLRCGCCSGRDGPASLGESEPRAVAVPAWAPSAGSCARREALAPAAGAWARGAGDGFPQGRDWHRLQHEDPHSCLLGGPAR